jgi:hypothetical protein
MNSIGGVADKLYEVIEAYRAQVATLRNCIPPNHDIPSDVVKAIIDGDQRIIKAEKAIKEAIK